jgi:hypothetical protein
VRVALRGLVVRSLAARRSNRLVQLRFVLDRGGRITLAFLGPAPGCEIAGRLTIAGRPGTNTVRFAGRIRDRLLRPGVYTISPTRGVAGPVSARAPVAVRVDADGARPVQRVPRLSCRSATPEPVVTRPGIAAVAGLDFTQGPPPVTPAAPVVPADRPAGPSRSPIRAARAVATDIARDPWPTVAVVGLLAAAALLLGLATMRLGYTAYRLRVARALEAHREEVGMVGALFLSVAVVIWLSMQLS